MKTLSARGLNFAGTTTLISWRGISNLTTFDLYRRRYPQSPLTVPLLASFVNRLRARSGDCKKVLVVQPTPRFDDDCRESKSLLADCKRDKGVEMHNSSSDHNRHPRADTGNIQGKHVL